MTPSLTAIHWLFGRSLIGPRPFGFSRLPYFSTSRAFGLVVQSTEDSVDNLISGVRAVTVVTKCSETEGLSVFQ